MIKILGCWENGWNYPLLEFDLYSFPAIEYGVDELIMTPISGIDKKVTEFRTIEQAIKANRDLEIVFIDENGEQELDDFEHPENVMYVFGRASYAPMLNNLQYKSVRIKTPAGKGRLWGHQAMTLILDNRFKKCH